MNESSPRSEIALVTGAATRIGAAIARRLAAAGYAVIVHYRNTRNEAEALVADIMAKGGRAAAIAADLADRPQRAGLIARAAAPFGPLTLLVNNASLFAPDSIATLSEALWDAHFAIHAEAPVFLSRDFARQLPPETDAAIVNILDSRMWNLSPAYASYTLSKSVLMTATTTMAQELSPHIRVNAVGPGPTLPEADSDPAAFARRVAELPLGRGATPEEVADAVLYLARARAVTGQMLSLDGGQFLEWPSRTDPTPRRP